jgi:Carboxypeptidase regulatory-like domain/TonB-dependent Receptor Plug Domain
MARQRNARGCFTSFGITTLTIFFFLLILGPLAVGQVDQGAVLGIVQDPTGAVVGNAKVTLLNTDVGLSLEATTNSSGEYLFTPVRTGHYTVTVTAAGFSTTTQSNLTVTVGQHLQANIQLKAGATAETVEVTTAPPLLQTDESSVGQVIGQQAVNSLPLNGRNFTFLAQLGAGVNTPQADTRGNAASGAFTANGLRPAQNNYLLDGIDNNSDTVDFLNGTNFIVLPPVDAIQEFKVQTANFSADLGRSAGAVLNATIKTGTNSLHGAVWEFFRNDRLDSADWFENNSHTPKGELRFNQFGASIGGPIIKNKMFFFGDYEGLRRVQGAVAVANVPTNAMRNSTYTNLADLINAQSNAAARLDNLGRSIPSGTVLDPWTTRAVTQGTVDPVSGLVASGTGYVRDPFTNATCHPSTLVFTLTGCGLNQLPASRLNANAIKLLNLYPIPTNGSLTQNFGATPNGTENRNAFDTRIDFNPSEKEQVFFRFSYVDDPQFIPGVFGGIADGGAFQQGNQTATAQQAALGWTHMFTPTAVNVARAGFNHLHTTRFGPEGSNLGIPAQYGIQGIPQVPENGGLPAFGIGGLQTLGSNSFLPSDEVSQTLQVTDDFTKIYGKHNFKMGIEYQHIKFSTLQPAWSRGQFTYSGTFTDIPGKNQSTTGIAQFLLPPGVATVPNGISYSGGSDQIYASNINKTYDEKNYFASYFQDDWKVSPKLTLNLGLRWDYFGPISESNGGQANFVPSGPPNNKPEYLIPTGKDDRTLSASFTNLLAKDGIALVVGNQYGKGLVQVQKSNFAPRVGFAYSVTPKFVTRGGFGMFYNAFENQGYGPNIGENYPFVYNFNYVPQGTGTLSTVAPISANTPYAGCPTAGPGGTGTFEAGFSCLAFSPSQVNASGLNLQGLQFDYKTPVTYSANLSTQYSITPTLTAQIAYVFTQARNLQTGIGNNNVSTILPFGADTSTAVPFPDFGHGASYQVTIGRSTYNGLQTKIEKQLSNGLSFLAAYTWSKTLSNAGDLLNGGSTGGFRAPSVPGFGPNFDRGLADFDIRNVFHISGAYYLPFGKGKKYLSGDSKAVEYAVGGWSVNWISTLQGGQPITLNCPSATTAGTNCYDLNVPTQSQKLGKYTDAQGKLNWFGNPKAFGQPCQLGASGPISNTPSNCFPLTGQAILGGGLNSTTGPGLQTFDFSVFKAFQLTERFSLQFRSEFFNILNHPNFNAPGFGGNGVVAVGGSTDFTNANFGEIGSTRTAPRQIQFALKLYY